MRLSRLQQIICACVLGALTIFNGQAGWLKRRIYTGLPGSSITNLYGTNLPGQVVFPDFPDAVDTLPVLPLTGPFTAETQISYTNDFGSWTPGYLDPPQTGEYQFWLYGDETAELWLAGLQLIDQALGWSVNRDLAVGVGGQPEFVATTVENGQITVTWRNGSLESTTRLTPPVAWQDLGTSGTLAEPSGSGMRFFRVKQ